MTISSDDLAAKLKCPKCGSNDISIEDYDANSGGCGDPECCGGPYWMKEPYCNTCKFWERLIDDDLEEIWSRVDRIPEGDDGKD